MLRMNTAILIFDEDARTFGYLLGQLLELNAFLFPFLLLTLSIDICRAHDLLIQLLHFLPGIRIEISFGEASIHRIGEN